MVQDAYWCDVGTPAEYRRVHRDALEGRVRLAPSEGATMLNGVLLGRGSRAHPSANIIAPSCVGHDVVVEAGATVDRSIVWSGAKIGAGARIIDAVIGNGVTIEASAVV